MSSHLTSELEILERQIKILAIIRDHEPIGLVAIANRTTYPISKVRYTIKTLEEANQITKTTHGIELQATTPALDPTATHLRHALTTIAD